ncbi:MAG: translation elongation factor Ts [Acidimicrobiia bacterium]|jgi:elongation factor Ts|nr:translation elongation factor Ts [Acidimicrobiia bacterium]MBP8181214.1 translation elongation factor Ts [Acidimicrobiia bacterium]
MANIAAKDVAALRKLTGAGMMDCKKALGETEGDIEAAKTWLREKGLAAAAKRTGRDATQGSVVVARSEDTAVVLELACETDFVAKGEGFLDFAQQLADQALTDGSDLLSQKFGDTTETVDEAIKSLAGSLGENISLGRVERFQSDSGLLDVYLHVQSDRGVLGVVVEIDGVDRGSQQAKDTAHDVALHIASAAPRYVTDDQVPESEIVAEREVVAVQAQGEGKPENVTAKIVEGRMKAFLKEIVLVDQPYIRDTSVTVGQLVSQLGPDAKVTRFARVKIGEN